MAQPKKSFYKELMERYDRESPDFFKRFFRLGRTLVAFTVAIFGAEAAIPGVKVPGFVLIIAGHFGVAGLAIMAVAKAACKQPIKDEDVPGKKPPKDV